MISTLRHRIATSDHPGVVALKSARKRARTIGLALPPVVFRPFLWAYLALRTVWYQFVRIFVCEPLFRAHCRQVGRRFRTGVFIHWVQGAGRIILGDDVILDGKSSFTFGASFSEAPTLKIGNRTTIGHGCSFAVGKGITIGDDCMLAQGVALLDSSGHSLDPVRRLAHLPPLPDEVKPVVVGNNVWIGDNAKILPGTIIGDGTVVAAGSVVSGNIPANVLVAGYPARKLRDLTLPS